MWRDREPQPEPTSKHETQRKITHFVSRRIVIIARPNVIIISVVPSLIIVVVFLLWLLLVLLLLFLHFMVTFSIDRSIHISFDFLFLFSVFLFRFFAKQTATRFWISIVIIVAVAVAVCWLIALFWKLKALETMLTIIGSKFIHVHSVSRFRFVLWAPCLSDFYLTLSFFFFQFLRINNRIKASEKGENKKKIQNLLPFSPGFLSRHLITTQTNKQKLADELNWIV